jgi:metal transporter CNNM
MVSRSSAVAGQSNYNGINTHRPGVQGLAKVLFLVLAQLSHASAAPLKQFFGFVKAEEPDPEDASMWLYLTIAAILVLLGGAFAGLTIA